MKVGVVLLAMLAVAAAGQPARRLLDNPLDQLLGSDKFQKLGQDTQPGMPKPKTANLLLSHFYSFEFEPISLSHLATGHCSDIDMTITLLAFALSNIACHASASARLALSCLFQGSTPHTPNSETTTDCVQRGFCDL